MSEEEKTGIDVEELQGTEAVTAGRDATFLRKINIHTDVNLVTITRDDSGKTDDGNGKKCTIHKVGDGYYNISIADEEISGKHCAIYKSGDGYFLYDGIWWLNKGKFSVKRVVAGGEEQEPFQEKPSTNGTYLNFKRFETGKAQALKSGDKVTVCRSTLEIVLP